MATTMIETPEERELASKRLELEVLQSQLADAELEYHTLHAQLGAFESQYFEIVGRRLVRIDELHAQIAEAKAARNPKDERIVEGAAESRRQAQSSAKAFEAEAPPVSKGRFRPTEECRKLYLQAAKAMHPDLAPSDAEKERRHKFMASLNEAYEAGDEDRIRQILNEWNSCPEAIVGDGVGAELIRTIRQIAQVHARLRGISIAKDSLQQGGLCELWRKANEANSDATVYLEQLARTLDEEISSLEREFQRV